MGMNMEKKILIIEDDQITLTIMKTMVEQKGYEVHTANDGAVAIKLTTQEDFPVIITDLRMPIMGGLQFIDYLHASNVDPVILVVSGEEDVETVITIMKRGVYDYLIKPVERNEFLLKIEKAFELAEIKGINKILQKEREIIHSQKTDWAAWKDALLRKKMEKIDQNLLTNLTTGLSQGAGFGGLISLIQVIPMQAKESGDHYLVPKEVINLIMENANTAGKILDDFSEIGRAINSSFSLSPATVGDFGSLVNESIAAVEKFLLLKNQTIKINVIPESIIQNKIEINKENLKRVIVEMLINAMKFSENNSEIFAFSEPSGKKLSFVVTSHPPKKGNVVGIPPEYEKKVFEPFFRLNKSVFEDYPTLDFGIGLTMIQSIMQSHNGKVSIKNMDDYAGMKQEKEIQVAVEITLPFV